MVTRVMTTNDPGHIGDETPKATAGNTISIASLAWMAGVVDLRGAVTVKRNKSRRTPQVVLRVDTKETRVARKLAALTGVKPEQTEKRSVAFARRGCWEHCLEPHVHVHEDGEYPWQMPEVTRWALTGATAAAVLLNLRPYMTTYSDYAAEVHTILVNLVITGQGAGMVRASLDRLRELGWVIPAEIEEKMQENQKEAV
jgi:hypothetical protein